VVALPLALAFGVASGAGAAAGLHGAIVLGFVAALLGGTRMQISGPTGPMTVVFASALAVVGSDVVVALVAITLLATAAGFAVPMIGDIPRGLPALVLPAFTLETWTTVLLLGITLGLLGSIDSLLTSRVADSITRTRHHSNRALIGQGIGNLLCAFVGGLPGAGATMRTVINIKSGGSGRASGVVHALFLLALLLGLGPLAVLAGILIKVGVDILDYRMLRLVRTAPRPDVAVMAAVFVLTVLVDLIVAVGAGVVLSMMLIIHRLARQASFRVRPPHREADAEGARLESEFECALESGIRVIEIDGAFFFGSASQLLDRVDRVNGTRVAVFDCSRMPFMDLSAQFALEEMIEGLKAQDIAALVVVPPPIHGQLLRLRTPHLPAAILRDDLAAALVDARALAARGEAGRVQGR
jgi:SulP family sulfate permease